MTDEPQPTAEEEDLDEMFKLFTSVEEKLDPSGFDETQSVNDYVSRVRAACQLAHSCARAGIDTEEEQAWLDVAAIALSRVTHIRRILDSK